MIRVHQSVSDPGRKGRANEDMAGAAGRFAWIIDGATGLGERQLIDSAPSDAAWLSATLHIAMEEAAERMDNPLDLLTHAAAEAERQFVDACDRAPEERYEIPTAAVLVARFGDDGVETVDLGDCAIYLAAGGEIARFGGTEHGRALEQENARRTMGTGSGRTPEVQEMLRTIRNKANTPDGYSIIAPSADSARPARRHRHPAPAGDALLLTDGFEAAIEDYALHTPASLIEAARSGLGAPLAALRDVERSDPDCTRFPRFKPSDDATALFLTYGGGR